MPTDLVALVSIKFISNLSTATHRWWLSIADTRLDGFVALVAVLKHLKCNHWLRQTQKKVLYTCFMHNDIEVDRAGGDFLYWNQNRIKLGRFWHSPIDHTGIVSEGEFALRVRFDGLIRVSQRIKTQYAWKRLDCRFAELGSVDAICHLKPFAVTSFCTLYGSVCFALVLVMHKMKNGNFIKHK